MKFIPIILFLTCYTSCEASQTGTYLIPNVLILQVNESMSTMKLNLSCGNHSGVISWKHNGNPMKEHGHQITTVLKRFVENNYTCHSETGNVLNYTLVLQQGIGFRKKILFKNESSDFLDYISCSAKNFDGKFQCTWNKSTKRNNAELIHFTVARVSGGSENITCSLDGNTLSCEDKSHCPFAEEPSRISLSVYFRSHSLFEEYHRQFFISEIVKPEKVIITKVEHRKLKWECPTWSNPPSYFQLIFQVKVIKPDFSCELEGHIKTIKSEYTVPNKKRFEKSYKLCVRAQEEASNSIWSDWSSYTVTPGK